MLHHGVVSAVRTSWPNSRGKAALAMWLIAVGSIPGVACSKVMPSPSASQPFAGASDVIWSDEFDGPSGKLPDASKWTFDAGNNNGWGNRELQTYSGETENVHLDGAGHLIIRALRTANGFTSARLKTQGLFAARFGRIEARIKLPSGQGLWPAFWMLGDNYPATPWPQCGEIDIMENMGREPSRVHGTVHGPGYAGGAGITGAFTLPGNARFSEDFHIFAVDWSPGAIEFLVDGSSYQRITADRLPAGALWLFDQQPYFLLLNLAVGGDFPGNPDETTVFPQEMMIDYVRVMSQAAQRGQR